MILNSWGLKGSRKSAGGLTTKVLKGQTVASQKRAKGQSNPSPQYLQSQAAAAIIVSIFQKIGAAVRPGFTSKGALESSYNAFYAYTYLNAFDLSSPPDVTLEPANVLISKGSMTPTPYSATTTAVGSTGVITFHNATTEADATQLSTDIQIFAVYNTTQHKWFGGLLGATRATAAPTVTAPAGFMVATDVIEVYRGFYGDPLAINTGTSSNSVAASVTVS